MRKFLVALLASVSFCTSGDARSVAETRTQPKFYKQLEAIIRVVSKPGGFELLKEGELARGMWNCSLPLEGFIPVVETAPGDPRGKLVVMATSVLPKAYQHAQGMVLNGLRGFELKDSQTDKDVKLDPATEERKLVLSHDERYSHTVVTVTFVAHRYNSVRIAIESWQ